MLERADGLVVHDEVRFARSSSAPPRTSQAMRHIGATVATPPAVMTSGFVVALIMALNCLG